MAVEYCNIGADLVDAFHDIEKYNRRELVDSALWENVTGTIYRLEQTGYVEKLIRNGVEMTTGTSISPANGEFYYEPTANAVYVNTGGSPASDTMHLGLDWDEFKKRARNDAQEVLESFLKSAYPTPFQKVSDPVSSYNSRSYDFQIRRATALLTCSMIIRKVAPSDSRGDVLYKEVDYPNPEIGDSLGIVQRILSGDIVLRTQRSAREIGGFNVYEGSSNSTTAIFEVSGRHSLTSEQQWKIVVDGAGVPGTATYKLSTDSGATFTKTLQATLNTGDDLRIDIGSGIYCRFTGTFVVDDEVTIHLFPYTDSATISGGGNIRLNRG